MQGCVLVDTVSTLSAYITARAAREADLPGERSTHYFLSATTVRLQLDEAAALDALAATCTSITGSASLANGVLQRPLAFRPPLVAQTKDLLDQHSEVAMRFVLDIDTNKHADRMTVRPCTAQEIGELVHTWAVRTLHIDEQARVLVFFGTFVDKPASLHVYFVDYCLPRNASATYAHNKHAFRTLNEALAPYGLEVDTSICSSGVKLPFGDKWLKTQQWRGDVQRVFFCSWQTALSYEALFELANPRCDPAQCREIVWPAQPQNAQVARATRTTHVLTGEGDLATRIATAVPQWRGVQFRKYTQAQGRCVWVPQCKHCPFKNADHSNAGACYVCIDAMHAFTVACHKSTCAGQQLHSNSSAVESEFAAILQRFNPRCAILPAGVVMYYPLELPDGSVVKRRELSYKKFGEEERRAHERVTLNKRGYFWPDLWVQLNEAKRYKYGVICDPTCTADEGYFNTWLGFDPQVLRAAAQFENTSDDDLWMLIHNYAALVRSNICNDEVELWNFWLDWCADLLQHPEAKRGRALALLGPPGCGKNQAVDMLLRIVGTTHSCMVGSEAIADDFNSILDERALVVVNEAQALHRERDHAKLKMLITELQGIMHGKYRDRTQVTTFQHVIVISNETGIRAETENERRFVAFACAQRAAGDTVAFHTAVAQELHDVNACAAFYTLCMRRDVQNVNWSRKILSKALWQTVHAALSTYERYWYHVLCTGDLAHHVWNVPDGNAGKVLLELAAQQANKINDMHLRDEATAYSRDGVQQHQHADTMEIFCFGVLHDHANSRITVPFVALEQGYRQRFPYTRNNDSAELGKLLASYQALLPPEHSMVRDRTRLMQGSVSTVVFPSLAALRVAFERKRACVDARVWDEWKVE